MKLFFGLVFILVGVLLLFGFFTANLWANVLDNFIAVWPVIFIFIGLSAKRQQPYYADSSTQKPAPKTKPPLGGKSCT